MTEEMQDLLEQKAELEARLEKYAVLYRRNTDANLDYEMAYREYEDVTQQIDEMTKQVNEVIAEAA